MKQIHQLAVFIALTTVCYSTALLADIRLPAIFSDNMVLQRNGKAPVWGWADPNEKVAVLIGDAKAITAADAEGRWTVNFDGLRTSDKPIDVTITGKNLLTLHNVLIGDVWVCSGQSNMEFPFGGDKMFGAVHDAATEIPKANHPTLRLFIVKKKIAFEPQADCSGSWVVCTPATAAKFSAVGYFFGRDILESQQVPVGLIGSYWGATPAQAWTSVETLKAHVETSSYADLFEKIKVMPANKRPKYDQHLPTGLSNGMIEPIVHFGIKGAIWYQGEGNALAAKQYQTLFPAMINDWRTRWGQGDFPFIWVQLPNFRNRDAEPTQTTDGWPALREAQGMALKLPNTAQAVTIDIGQANDIHPKDKSDVGRRLAFAARHVAYREDITYSGPTFDSFVVQGDTVIVKFRNIGKGLAIAAAPSTQPGIRSAPAGDILKGFCIAGSNKKFVWATATLQRSTGPDFVEDSVLVRSPAVKEPKAIRYGWANNPDVNLYNREGFPAEPFRTDDWDQLTSPTSKKHK